MTPHLRKQRNSRLSLLAYYPSLRPTGNPDELKGVCLDCGKPKLYWNTRKNVGYCQVCGERKLLDFTSRDRERNRGSRSTRGSVSTRGLGNRHPKENVFETLDRHPLALRYLSSRGVSSHEVSRLGILASRIGKCEVAIRFGDSYQRRVTSERGSFSYQNYIPGGTAIHPWILRAGKEGSPVLVEGPFDAIRVWRAGFTSACCFGKPRLSTVAALFVRHVLDRVLLLFDSDAKREAHRLLQHLACWGVEARDLTPALIEGKDPDEHDEEQLRRILSS